MNKGREVSGRCVWLGSRLATRPAPRSNLSLPLGRGCRDRSPLQLTDPVRIGGVRVGQVSSIGATPEGESLLRLPCSRQARSSSTSPSITPACSLAIRPRAQKVVRTWAAKYKRAGGDPDQRALRFSWRGNQRLGRRTRDPVRAAPSASASTRTCRSGTSRSATADEHEADAEARCGRHPPGRETDPLLPSARTIPGEEPRESHRAHERIEDELAQRAPVDDRREHQTSVTT